MSHADPRFRLDPAKPRRAAPGWGSRLLTLLLRLGMVAVVVLVFLVCRELGRREKQKTAVQLAGEAELQQQQAVAEGALEMQRDREGRLLDDPTYLEYVAREQLGLARPGETLIQLEDPVAPATPKD